MRNNRPEKRIKVKITFTEILNSFIKIKAQDVNSDEFISLLDLKSIFKSIDDITEEDIKLGDNIYIARLDFDTYARCRIIEMNDYRSMATIDLIDCGFKNKISYNQLRILPKSSSINLLPSICKEFVIAELILSKEHCDYRQKFAKFSELVVNKFFDLEILSENSAGKYVQLYSMEASIVHDIIPNHPTLKTIMKRINLRDQMSLMHEQYINESYDEISENDSLLESSSRELKKLCSIEEFQTGVKHEIRISSYENGPRLFYVHSIESLPQYQDFHVKLQKLSLQPLKNRPRLSDICLAFLESNNVQRVEIIEIKNDIFKVRLVDHGSERMVNLTDLFEIPEEIKVHKPFAWKFALYQVEQIVSLSHAELNFYFQFITMDKRLSLYSQVGYNATINSCTLFDGDNSIFDMLKKYDPRSLRYPPNVGLSGTGPVQKVKIVYIESPWAFFINVCDQVKEQKGIIEEFSKFNPCLYRNLSIGSACCVKINGRNCRGQFVKKSASICQIKLIDIGLIEEFSCNEVKLMIEKFVKFPPLAYKCCLVEFKNLPNDKATINNFFTICKRYQVLTMNIKSVENDVYYVTLENESGQNIANELLSESTASTASEQLCRKCSHTSINTETQTDLNPIVVQLNPVSSMSSLVDWTSEERKELGDDDNWDTSTDEIDPINFKNTGVVASIISPNDFTIQCEENLKIIEETLNDLQISAQNECPLTEFVCSTYCAAKNPYTEKWCRAIILDSMIDAENTLITVRDADNGQIFSIESIDSELKSLPFSSMIRPFYGIRCTLPIKIRNNLEDEATRLFNEIVSQKIRYEIVGCNQYLNVCNILSNGQNVADYLAKMNVATKLKTLPNGSVYIVHVKNLEEFYVQLKQEEEILNNVHQCSKSYEQISIKKPMEGMTVMSKSKEYNMWYRAKITEIKNGDIVVKYLDFGNEEKQSITEIGLVNDHLLSKTPPLAHRCSLNLPRIYDPNSSKAIEHLREIANKGYNGVIIRMVEAKLNRAIIELYNKDEKNISVELIDLCDKLEDIEPSDFSRDSSIVSSE